MSKFRNPIYIWGEIDNYCMPTSKESYNPEENSVMLAKLILNSIPDDTYQLFIKAIADDIRIRIVNGINTDSDFTCLIADDYLNQIIDIAISNHADSMPLMKMNSIKLD